MNKKPLIDFTQPEMALVSGKAPAHNRNALKKTTSLQKIAQGVFLSLALLTALGPSAQAFAKPYVPQQLTYIQQETAPLPNKIAGYTLDYPTEQMDIVEATTKGQFNKTFNKPIEQGQVNASDLEPLSLTDVASTRSWYDFNYINETKDLQNLNNKELINHTGEVVAIARHFIAKGETGENASNNLIEICKYATPAIKELQSRQELSNLTGTQQVFETCTSNEMVEATRSTNLKSLAAVAGSALLSATLKAVSFLLPLTAGVFVLNNIRKSRAKKEEEIQIEQSSSPPNQSPSL